MARLSIIIPSYKEPYLLNTINSILESAKGSIEIFVNVDDGQPIKMAKKDSRVKFNYPKSPLGMRGGINLGLASTKGRYIMKADAHCVFAPGFDKIITKMEDNWLVIPRRFALYADGWKRDLRFPPKDYHYISYPAETHYYGKGMFPFEWKDRRLERQDYAIDDTMIMQGSCYVASRKYFSKQVGLLDDRLETYSPFGGEQMEIGLKYWLGGGEVKVNKNTWYAHLFKNSRYYKEVADDSLWKHKVHIKSKGSWEWAARHWMNNEEPGMIHAFSWLIEKFWPVPTWPKDRSLWVYKS